jgi:hypothetical protein
MSTCDKCRHWGAERLKAIQHGNVLKLQARCLVDPARAAPPLMWEWQTCPKFAPDLREYQVPNPGAVVTDIRVVR